MESQIYQTHMDDLIPLIREQLAAGHSVRFSPKGISMLPMLRQGKDSVVLSPMLEKLRKYDLPLYQRENGKYILHRVIRVGETYTCMGDNQFEEEPGVTDGQIVGVVTAFYRGEKRYGINQLSYRLYCVFWYHSRHMRHLWKRGIRFLRRILN